MLFFLKIRDFYSRISLSEFRPGEADSSAPRGQGVAGDLPPFVPTARLTFLPPCPREPSMSRRHRHRRGARSRALFEAGQRSSRANETINVPPASGDPLGLQEPAPAPASSPTWRLIPCDAPSGWPYPYPKDAVEYDPAAPAITPCDPRLAGPALAPAYRARPLRVKAPPARRAPRKTSNTLHQEPRPLQPGGDRDDVQGPPHPRR